MGEVSLLLKNGVLINELINLGLCMWIYLCLMLSSSTSASKEYTHTCLCESLSILLLDLGGFIYVCVLVAGAFDIR